MNNCFGWLSSRLVKISSEQITCLRGRSPLFIFTSCENDLTLVKKTEEEVHRLDDICQLFKYIILSFREYCKCWKQYKNKIPN